MNISGNNNTWRKTDRYNAMIISEYISLVCGEFVNYIWK